MPAPTAAQRIRWPASFGTRFLVFCDVEEEFDWRAPLSRANRGTRAMAAFPDAHRRFAAAGVGLACMVDQPIAEDARAMAMLAAAAADGRSAIGAQLHSWVTPPHLVGEEPSHQGRLPPRWEAAKIDTITAALTAATGRAPVAFRAGRYGIGPATLRLLAARGYRIDSSVRARYDYRADGGPDFRAVGAHAYRADGMIELPLTTAFVGRLHRGGRELHRLLGRVPLGRGAAARLRMLERVALTPEDMPLRVARAAIDVALGEGVRLLSFSFHSPTLAPGHTPYARDAADVAAFWAWWDGVFVHLARRGVAAASLVDVLAAADGVSR